MLDITYEISSQIKVDDKIYRTHNNDFKTLNQKQDYIQMLDNINLELTEKLNEYKKKYLENNIEITVFHIGFVLTNI
jgi:hypothetical protein